MPRASASRRRGEASGGPVIGITADNAENTAASGRYEVGVGYAAAVAAAGGVPLVLPHETGAIDRYVAMCDGLLLTGGVDPDTAALPAGWPGREATHGEARVMDPGRQAFELALLDAWESVKPQGALLGVCLGMQWMALRAGGRLEQFMPATRTAEVVERHRQADHAVRVTAGDSVLRPPPEGGDAVVHSNHQQAVADPGRLRVVAVCPDDGVVEAVDDAARPFCLGVQWHPERMTAARPLGWPVITGFVEAARRAKADRDRAVTKRGKRLPGAGGRRVRAGRVYWPRVRFSR
ncbi:MAG: gamma-glutamyl-gamma-aminobutyrate hydrolase family protein [Planctomycetota bacterium]